MPSIVPSTSRPARRWMWPLFALGVSVIPFAQGLTGSRLFYIRDLSSYFWGRYLWLRHAWIAGEFPLWDPYIGGGQAAYSDALHQMFLPPAILARLIGNDVFGFNLWVLLPFPLAALGAWGFLSRRFSDRAATLGAIAFAVCGPTVSTGDCPNLSWAVAALPWVLWTTDRLASAPAPRNVALLALAVAMQALSGEPVTLFTTLVLAGAYAFAVEESPRVRSIAERARLSCLTGIGAALGLALAAIQVVPMVLAARLAERGDTIAPDLWSLRPTALLETVWMHLFGNYFTTQSLAEVPWMPLVYTSREPLLFSIYFGAPLLALAALGLAGTGPRRLRLFWLFAGLTSVLAAFGSYTPLYPILRDHVPPFGSFRFPVKYIAVAAMAIAAGAAAGWDALGGGATAATDAQQVRRARRARLIATGLPLSIAATATALAAACLFAPTWIAPRLDAFAHALGAEGHAASAFMIRTAPRGAGPVAAVGLAAAALLALATRSRSARLGAASLYALSALIVGDLLVHAVSVNPVLDAARFAQPAWLSYAQADPNRRIYVGGKIDSTLDMMDVDASRAYLNAPGLTGSASRATLNIQAAFYPSAWHVREMVSFDLPVIWPKISSWTNTQFVGRGRDERDRFLQRTGVRFRVLPQRSAGQRQPLMAIPQFYESFLFDYGDDVARRVAVVPEARVLPDPIRQVDALFAAGWDSSRLVLIDRNLDATGERNRPAALPSATFIEDSPNRSVIDAAVGAGSGYLLVLDSYADDWQATVDGRPATVARADGLFRAVHLPEGRHRVEFIYRPQALVWGTAITAAASLAAIALLLLPGSRRSMWNASDTDDQPKRKIALAV
jgi:hypothetical protein